LKDFLTSSFLEFIEFLPPIKKFRPNGKATYLSGRRRNSTPQQHHISHRSCSLGAPVSSVCIEKCIGLGCGSSQQSLPVQTESPFPPKKAKEKSKFLDLLLMRGSISRASFIMDNIMLHKYFIEWKSVRSCVQRTACLPTGSPGRSP
jgi:hypothetical protein